MKKNISNQINSLTQWMWIILTLILCSFTLLAYAGNYVGDSYFDEPMQILPGTIEHEHHDNGDDGVAYHELYSNTDSRAPKMAPGEWANYTVRIPDGTMDGQLYLDPDSANPNPVADISASTDVFINAATPCKQAGKYGELTFSINGGEEEESRSISIRIDTNGEFETVNGKRVRKYELLDTSGDSGTLMFYQTDKENDHLFIKVESTGTCGVYLDWFDFLAPTPAGMPVFPD